MMIFIGLGEGCAVRRFYASKKRKITSQYDDIYFINVPIDRTPKKTLHARGLRTAAIFWELGF